MAVELAGQAKIFEVGPRDGLQNQSAHLSVDQRIAFIEKLIAAGLRNIEVGSFVSPKWVPQMADTDKVLAGLRHHSDVVFSALVPNERGLDSALAAGAREIAVFSAASDQFSRRNTNSTIAQSLATIEKLVARALNEDLTVRGYVSCVLGCPYEGDVAVSRVVEVAAALHDMGCYEISLGDTIGVGTPARVVELVRSVRERIPVERLAVHFHDTYGQALANIHAAVGEGVRVVDASVGGLGGCPYASGASGNVATESVLYMLNGMGLATGLDMDRLLDAARHIEEALGAVLDSRIYRAIAGTRNFKDANA